MGELDRVNTWFSLTYARYLVLPRLFLEHMPDEWQNRFVDLLDELEDEMPACPEGGTYSVNVRGPDGRFIRDRFNDYRRGQVMRGTLLDEEER